MPIEREREKISVVQVSILSSGAFYILNFTFLPCISNFGIGMNGRSHRAKKVSAKKKHEKSERERERARE